tara:strand:- start:3487 stop:4605 length:1119 start_codon:yes stop_codon:yes gene_type:complete
MAWYDDLFSTGLTVAGMRKAQTDLESMGLSAANAASGVAQEGLTQTGFKPFTVTTGVGGATTTPTGGFTTTLSPQQQALQNTLFGGSGQLAGQATAAYDPRYAELANQAYGGVGGLMSQAQQASLDAGSMDRGAREQQVYGQLRALQSPEEERQRLALENRLASQGRLGVSTAQYGGTPEQLAMAKAQAEGQNQASLMAMQQSGAEQQQALQRASGLQGLTSGMFGMGTAASSAPRQLQGMDLQNLAGMMSAGYAPDAQLMNSLGLGTNLSQIAGLGQRAGANLYGEAELSGIQAQLEAQQRSAELERSMFSSLAQFAGSKDQSGKGLLGQILSGLGGGGSASPNQAFIDSLTGQFPDLTGEDFKISDLWGG